MNLGVIFGICSSLLLFSLFLSPYSSLGKNEPIQKSLSSVPKSSAKPKTSKSSTTQITLETVVETTSN